MENAETNPQIERSLSSQILFPHPHMPSVKADVLGFFDGWPISNTTTFLFFTLILFVIFTYSTKNFKAVPNFFQSIVEVLLESIENLINSLTGGKKHRNLELFYPIAAIFLIVGTINILGSFPIISEFTWKEGEHIMPFFRKATSDINVTLPLALTIVLSMQFFGVKNWGFFGYFKRFLPLDALWKGAKKGFGEFALALIEVFVGMLEFVSEIVKVISLSLRLFVLECEQGIS